VQTVAAVRGLPERTLIPIDRLSEGDFSLAIRERQKKASPSGDIEAASFLLAFNLASEATASRRVTPMHEVLEEQVVGFYDQARARIFVRDTTDPTEEGATKELLVLAHEVQHALQAQHFPALGFGPETPEDARLAHLALLEGDAMVTSAAYLAIQKGVPLRRILRVAGERTRAASVEDLLKNDGQSSALRTALPILRERLLFPYHAGMSFVGDIYRAGGFPMVNGVFARPPSSTEQVLHPQAYLDGEEPVPVSAPPPPPGYQIIAAERMGELQTRAILAECVDQASAARAAAGWGGDAWSVAASPDRRLALLWSTAWDSPEDAAEFEYALRSRPACWSAASLGGASGFRIEGDYRVIRDGAKVAFVRGLPEPTLSQAAALLLTLPGKKPPRVANAVAVPQIPPTRPIPPRARGFVASGMYHSPWLGVMASLPSDMNATTMRPEMELHVGRPGALVSGALLLSNRLATPEWNERTLYEIGAAFARELEDRRFLPASGGPTIGPLGPGVERTWRVEGSSVELRVVIVPVCEGTGSYVFAQTYSDPQARYVLDWWLASFRWATNVPPPVCDWLNPL
jgi:hypothetical protein